MPDLRPALSPLDREQCSDLRRTVLCGELHLGREAAWDAFDETAFLVLVVDGEKPIGTGRLVARGRHWCVEHVAVLGYWRRQGIGQRLVQALVGEARRREAASILAVGPYSALPFLQACGFDVQSQDEGVVLTVLSVD